MYKAILGILAFIISGGSFIAAFLGYFLGLLIDYFRNQEFISARRETPEASYEYYKRKNSVQDFTTMLMVLSAVVMRADGKVLKSELEFVKAFFRRNLGDHFDVAHLQILKHYLNTPQVPYEKICNDIRLVTKIEDRILILHYLFGIAAADNSISASEINVIQRISLYLGISTADYQSAQNMFVRKPDSDYKILGIPESATNDEVKKAYRELALRYHPDRVAHLGEEYQKGAKEQFQKIQEAYENIKKSRGFN